MNRFSVIAKISVLVAVVLASVGGCASECSRWQPGSDPKAANGGPGIPGPGPASFGNRVLYGKILKQDEATWPNLGQDVYLHMKANPNLILTPDQMKAAAEGTRVIMGPASTGQTIKAAIRSVPQYDTTNALTHDLCADIDGGYAAIWGWRPYVRMQRISATAIGTQIIGRVVSSTPNLVVERVYLVENSSGSPVTIRELHTNSVKATLTASGTFVDLTTVVTGSTIVTTAGAIQNIPAGDTFVTGVKAKMN